MIHPWGFAIQIPDKILSQKSNSSEQRQLVIIFHGKLLANSEKSENSPIGIFPHLQMLVVIYRHKTINKIIFFIYTNPIKCIYHKISYVFSLEFLGSDKLNKFIFGTRAYIFFGWRSILKKKWFHPKLCHSVLKSLFLN